MWRVEESIRALRSDIKHIHRDPQVRKSKERSVRTLRTQVASRVTSSKVQVCVSVCVHLFGCLVARPANHSSTGGAKHLRPTRIQPISKIGRRGGGRIKRQRATPCGPSCVVSATVPQLQHNDYESVCVCVRVCMYIIVSVPMCDSNQTYLKHTHRPPCCEHLNGLRLLVISRTCAQASSVHNVSNVRPSECLVYYLGLWKYMCV